MRNNIIITATRGCAALAATLALSGTAWAQYGRGPVVFGDVNFDGGSQVINSDIPDMRDLGLNDTISSLQIPTGQVWQICEHINYEGRCENVSGRMSDLRSGDWNDKISSMRLLNEPGFRNRRFGGNPNDRPVGTSGVNGSSPVVFADVGFSGGSQVINRDIPDMRDRRLNDTISSIQIPRGQVWQICEDINYQGQCRNVSGSISDLRNGNWNDRISSIRIVSGFDGAVGTSGTSSTPQLVFYNRPNFRGSSAVVTPGSNRLLSARQGSLRVNGGAWRLCDSEGDCATVDSDVSNMNQLGLNGSITSIRPLNNGQLRRYQR